MDASEEFTAVTAENHLCKTVIAGETALLACRADVNHSATDKLCLLRINDQVPVVIFGVSEEAIVAALAQQESESLSANVRLGIQFRNQQGQVRVNNNWFLGYTKDEYGKLVIVPEEAEIVRRIYAEYLDGKSFKKIKQGLEADGILNGAKHEKWHDTNIRQILTNEKYIGDALLQKTYTVSVLDKKRVPNNGIVPKYYVEGSHDAIIDKDTFLRVQAELVRRSSIKMRMANST